MLTMFLFSVQATWSLFIFSSLSPLLRWFCFSFLLSHKQFLMCVRDFFSHFWNSNRLYIRSFIYVEWLCGFVIHLLILSNESFFFLFCFVCLSFASIPFKIKINEETHTHWTNKSFFLLSRSFFCLLSSWTFFFRFSCRHFVFQYQLMLFVTST